MVQSTSIGTDLLVGFDRTVTLRMILGAVALCPVLVVLWVLVTVGMDEPRSVYDIGAGLVVVLVALVSAVNGYLGGGLVASVALGISPPIAFGITARIADWLYNTQGDSPLWALVVGFIVIVGTIAVASFAVGAIARWLVAATDPIT